MHVGDTILAAAAESGTDEIFALLTINQHGMPLSIENIYQTSKTLPMEIIHMSTVIKD